jgi:hypothetical protein
VIYFSLVWAAFIANTNIAYGSSSVDSNDSLNLFLFTFYLFEDPRSDFNAGSEGSVTISVLKVDFESNTIASALKVLLYF